MYYAVWTTHCVQRTGLGWIVSGYRRVTKQVMGERAQAGLRVLVWSEAGCWEPENCCDMSDPWELCLTRVDSTDNPPNAL